jgi:hypothetical protein
MSELVFNFPALMAGLGLPCENLSNRQKVELLEYGLKQFPNPNTDELPLKHHLCNGVYMRELHIPAGTCLTGKIHKTAHLNVILQGDISVMTEDGIKRIAGPCVIQSQPGLKRAGFAHADTIWMTVHAIDKTDIAEIEDELVEDSDLSWISQLFIKGEA